ncbi:tRNA (guanine-N(7)-)-methyltransferase [Rubripirellula lacrimiformis]|uniref:tRNA (guanine-N(7)-)-methyltransferase n=1 Tax=Rubripirellula lacrimiformis TaxID=1930273 RepID=A0A517N8S0_9BACT|nr:tRNA (guanosine(46)-N7)-methyltransferase TrmB [Rubripirellula lacrimiformis]QDT03398.1 tRNA (guanine-N(7)-)-methyltransferase [Rubripirellula lacrimiformis]
MPRHQIRSPKSSVDLSTVLRDVDQLPADLGSQSMFGNDLPLEIEVGSGKGLFISTESVAHPEHNFLGVEIVGKYASHSAGRLLKAGSTNAIMISGNAEPLFEKNIAAGSLEAVHVYFPDPWWKKKHRKRRVVNETSVRNFSRALRVGGRFHFWTDVLDYFENTIEMIADIAPEFGVPIPEEEVEAQHDLDYRTHFERRSIRHQIPVYRVRYEKRVVG